MRVDRNAARLVEGEEGDAIRDLPPDSVEFHQLRLGIEPARATRRGRSVQPLFTHLSCLPIASIASIVSIVSIYRIYRIDLSYLSIDLSIVSIYLSIYRIYRSTSICTPLFSS